MARAQTATETLILLAVGLLVLGVIISYSSQQVSFVSDSKRVSEARASVEDLTRATNEVYSEGRGSRKEVFIRVPSSHNSSASYVGKPSWASMDTPSRTINLNVLIHGKGNDVSATTNYEVRGSLPEEPGGHWVTVIAREGYVQIGRYNLVVSPVGLSSFMKPDNTTVKTFEVSNEGSGDMDVVLSEDWNYSEVSIDVNESAFTLAPKESRTVSVSFNSSGSALDAYSGSITVNGTLGSDTDVIEVSLLAVVTLEQESKVSVYPNEWYVSMNTGMSTSKEFTVCSDFNTSKIIDLEITGDLNLSFTQGGTNLTYSKVVGGGLCSGFNIYLTVPGGTPGGERVGRITAGSSGYSDQSIVTVNVTQDLYPPEITIISPLNATYPNPWVWANVTLNEEGVSCAYSLDGAANETMTARSDSYYYKNVSGLSETPHSMFFYCRDTSNNIGTNNVSFAYEEADYPPTIAITSPDNKTYGRNWVWGNISLNEPAGWCGVVVDGPILLANATEINGSSGNTSFWVYVDNMTMGSHNLTFFCNDSIGQWSNESIWFSYNFVTENLTVVGTEPVGPCLGDCNPTSLNEHDYEFECELDHDPKNNKCRVPTNMSKIDGSANVTDVKVFIEEGFGEMNWFFGYPQISSDSMRVYISNSSVSDDGTIYCEEYLTPTLGDWNLVCPGGGGCYIDYGDNSTFYEFDCEDNPVAGGLDTVEEVNNMYVHIENDDYWGWFLSYTSAGQSYRIDHVIAQVTHN